MAVIAFVISVAYVAIVGAVRVSLEIRKWKWLDKCRFCSSTEVSVESSASASTEHALENQSDAIDTAVKLNNNREGICACTHARTAEAESNGANLLL